MEFKSVTEIPGFLQTNPLKLKAESRGKMGKFILFSIDLQENALPFYRKEWKMALMNRYVEIDSEIWQVKGIEAFAIHDSQPHKDVGLLVLPLSLMVKP